MSRAFGIDLGTTYSCISFIDEYGKAVVLKNSDGDHTTPSVVMLEQNGNIVVGSEAKRSVDIEPSSTVQFIKRKMGKEKDTVMLNGQEYHAPEISAWILKKLVDDANSELIQTGVISESEKINDVVITCPAYFGMSERQATKTAGEIVGLNILDIINEPTAAAISYGVSSKGKDETVLIYDLGGGTFDITIMEIKENNISVVCTGGDDQLGGKDWDECLMDYAIEKYNNETGEDLSNDPEAVASLYIDVENWKKSLTSREKINISINGSAGRVRDELTREQYNEMTQHLLNRTKNLLDDVIDEASKKNCPVTKIDKILLVGGSSRMPQVEKMLINDYNITPMLSDPDEAVSKGAAIYASNQKMYKDFILEESSRTGKSIEQLEEENMIDGNINKKFSIIASSQGNNIMKLNITNVLSRTYGIGIYVGDEYRINNLLMINQKLPAIITSTFQTRNANQKGAFIDIYESRSSDEYMPVEDRIPLTKIEMKFKSAVPISTDIIMTLSLDNSGIIHIIAQEQENFTKLDTTFQLSNQMNQDEMNYAQERIKNKTID